VNGPLTADQRARASLWRTRLDGVLGGWRDRLDPERPDPGLLDAIASVRALRVRLRLAAAGLVDVAEVHGALDAVRSHAPSGDDGRALLTACDGLAAELPAQCDVRREFYVYLHRALGAAVFYVGKGRGRRAWSRARTAVWHRYVVGRLGGRYEVEIVRDALSHSEALALEASLIAAHGPALVNWVNPAREFDTGALERARLLRAETLALVGTAQFYEESAPAEALRRYRLALADARVYCRLPVERGLLGELRDANRVGEPLVLDRLTRCLERLGRAAEIVAEVDAYFAEFPDARATPAGGRARRRRDRASSGRLLCAGPRRGPRRLVLG
jgi:hypothetical protein